MPDDQGQAAPPEGQATAPSLLSSDGNFAENWQTMLSDETLHDDKTLKQFKSLEGLAKSYVHARRQLPMNKIATPTDSYSDDEWNEWFKAGGRPETAQDYNIQRPQDYPEDNWNQDFANNAQEMFHKIGLSQKQADSLMAWYNSTTLSALKAQADAQAESVSQVEDALHQEWGAAYDQRIRMGNMNIEKDPDCVKDPDYKQRLLDKINRDPDLIRHEANIGSKWIEAGAPMPNVPTPGEIQEKIDDAMAHPSYSPDYLSKGFTKAQHNAQVEKVKRLFTERNENLKTGFI